MAEWFKAAVLKTVVLKGTGGSNPSLSAKVPCSLLQGTFFVYLLVEEIFRKSFLSEKVKTSQGLASPHKAFRKKQRKFLWHKPFTNSLLTPASPSLRCRRFGLALLSMLCGRLG